MKPYLRAKKVNSSSKGKPMGKALKEWLDKGMPLPGATYPPKGKTYLRGKLIKKSK